MITRLILAALVAAAAIAGTAHADISVTITGSNSKSVLEAKVAQVKLPATVLSVVEGALDQEGVHYVVGSQGYISAIADDSEASGGRGWCYTLNGQLPDFGMGAEWVPDTNAKIEVFYGHWKKKWLRNGYTCVRD